jgi:photosystem II stability/assembly factor-like uncharacterized protein
MTCSLVLQTARLSCQLVLLALAIYASACVDGTGAKHVLTKDHQQIRSYTFVGTDNLWLVTEDEGKLLLTNNGGRDWVTVPGQAVGSKFQSVGFLNDKQGLAVNGEGQVWKSVDGGLSWTKLAQLQSAKPSEWQFTSSHQIQFADERRAWIVETFTVWRTDDGGNTWRQIFSVLDPGTNGQPDSVYFMNLNAGWVITSNGRTFQTVDGGDNWVSLSLGKNINAKDVAFADWQTRLVLAFSNLPPYSQVYRTSDAGKTWTGLSFSDPNAVINSISLVNEQEAWAAGRVWTGDPETSIAVLLHTLDGGKNWQRVQLRQAERLFYRVRFVDSQHGWLFAHDNVYRTVDSGNDWRVVLKLPPLKNDQGANR